MWIDLWTPFTVDKHIQSAFAGIRTHPHILTPKHTHTHTHARVHTRIRTQYSLTVMFTCSEIPNPLHKRWTHRLILDDVQSTSRRRYPGVVTLSLAWLLMQYCHVHLEYGASRTVLYGTMSACSGIYCWLSRTHCMVGAVTNQRGDRIASVLVAGHDSDGRQSRQNALFDCAKTCQQSY